MDRIDERGGNIVLVLMFAMPSHILCCKLVVLSILDQLWDDRMDTERTNGTKAPDTEYSSHETNSSEYDTTQNLEAADSARKISKESVDNRRRRRYWDHCV